MSKTPAEKAEEALNDMYRAEVFQPKQGPFTQDWTTYNDAQTNEAQRFMRLLADLVDFVEDPNPDGPGRPPTPLSTIIYTSALKVYYNTSLRKGESQVKVAQELGYIDDICSYATISDRMQTEAMTQEIQKLIKITSIMFDDIETDFAADSSGFSTSRFDRYQKFKHGSTEEMRDWRELHIMAGVKTNIVVAAEVTPKRTHDAPIFKDLVERMSDSFSVNEIAADKAYSSRENLDIVDEQGGTPFIPFRSNTRGNAGGSMVWKNMYLKFKNRNGEFRRHYHKRSNVETVFHMIKTRFGDSLRSKNDESLRNELLTKVLCHNLCVVIQEIRNLDIEL